MEGLLDESSQPSSGKEKQRLTKKIHQQLISSCVCFPEKKDDDYIYVGEAARKVGSWLIFWKKKKRLSIKDRLIGSLLK